jgi:hypothetical protein
MKRAIVLLLLITGCDSGGGYSRGPLTRPEDRSCIERCIKEKCEIGDSACYLACEDAKCEEPPPSPPPPDKDDDD